MAETSLKDTVAKISQRILSIAKTKDFISFSEGLMHMHRKPYVPGEKIAGVT
jgi:hypothetical protein